MSADQKEKEHQHEHNPFQDSNQESFINKKTSSNRAFKVRSTAVDGDSESEGLNNGSSEPATFNEDEDTRNAERAFKNNECDASSVDTASTSTVSTDGCNCNGIACSGLKCLAATTLAAVLKSVLPENDAALKSADLAKTEQINTELFDPSSQETVDLIVGTDITPKRRLTVFDSSSIEHAMVGTFQKLQRLFDEKNELHQEEQRLKIKNETLDAKIRAEIRDGLVALYAPKKPVSQSE